MPIFYCTADGSAPAPVIDWTARQALVSAIPDDGIDGEGNPITTTRAAAQAARFAEQLASSHVVANGNGPRCASLGAHEVAAMLASGAAVVVVGDSRDEHGGGVASLVRLDGSLLGALLCPVCPAQVRAVESL